ncbi:AAA family ATPase [Bacillus sp. ISL-53]|nr:AAA family ATPase [Bacillus sp. ISL-53]
MIKRLNIEDWNQFKKIDINFHSKVTVLTGANGSGKSTLIRLLSKEMGWDYTATAIPSHTSEIKSKFLSGITLEKLVNFLENKPKNSNPTEYKFSDDSIQIGEITLDNNVCRLYVPEETDTASYNVYSEFENDNSYSINGVSIASHRQPYTYTNIGYIPVKPHTKNEAHNEYLESMKKRILPDRYYISNEDRSPVYHMKASLMSLAVFGAGNIHVSKDQDSYDLFRGFVGILKKLLPQNIQFQDIYIKDGEVILLTETGQFLLDAVSGGIGSIIDLAWQIYMYDNEEKEFVVLIDEIENHLHPSMQRQILPNLIDAFPNTQFIVTTHSPFVVNSVADSWVYALKYNEDNLIDSYKLDFESKASNALEILREILGVPVTLPIWIEEKLNSVTEKYRNLELTPEKYIQLKNDLKEFGLDQHLPQAIGELQMGVKR